MSRRGENIYKRKDGRWEGRYIQSYGTDGKAKYKSVYAGTYNELRVKMRTHTGSEHACSVNVSVVAWVTNYLTEQKAKIKISTAKLYERYIDRYIKPFFKNIILRKLNKEILQSFVNSMNDMSPSTVKGVFSFLREALKSAYKNDYITPVWIDVELPRQKKRKVDVFTNEEQCLIEKALNIEENPNDIGILICLYTGLRVGEVCGLKWEDIDFLSHNLTVNRTIQRMTIDNKSVLKELEPKSETSHRTIPIPSFLEKSCRRLKRSA